MSTQRFEQIYATNEWQYGSGEGSLATNTRGYAAMLERFLVDRQISSVVDMGCGDWQFSKDVRWGDANYRGYDVVASVIERNRQRHTTDKVSFHLYAGDPAELPQADLLIVKDVLQHLSNEKVAAFLPHLSRYRYALLTNCIDPRAPTTENRDIDDGDFRWLDLRERPFGLQALEVYSFGDRAWLRCLLNKRRWRKHVLLVDNDRAGAPRVAQSMEASPAQ